MEQEELEARVRRIFEEEGFDVRGSGGSLVAEREGERKNLEVFSSESYRAAEVEEAVSGDELVFVDQGLAGLQEELENRVSVLSEDEENAEDLPSFELIGDVAVINELVDMEEEESVEAITSQHPSVKTVLLKTGDLSGEYRVGDYRVLYGGETETVHTEFGCRFRVDPTEVYYSERFSTERRRVVSKVEDGERVLVMFAGVGPFAIMAARLADPEEVVAVEKNPVAAEYLRENLKLNSVGETVVPVEGDVRDVVPGMGEFDRIVMPLPEGAGEFLDIAEFAVASGGFIHFYSFIEVSESGNIPGEALKSVQSLSRRFEVQEIVNTGEKSPEAARFCIDIRIG